jgi:hypothetical protein
MKRILLILSAIMMAVCSFAEEQYSATPASFGNNFVLMGRNVKVPLAVTNTGTQTIRSLTYTIVRDGVEQIKTTSVSIAVGSTGSLNISFKADTEARKSPCTITITKVNAKANESAEKTVSGNIITITEKPVVVPVVEEFTGTWCGWCPVGFDGVENAHKTFGEKAALIAIHCGDVMESKDFQVLGNRIDGYPGAIIDLLQEDFYPATDEVKKKINQQLQNKIAAASIQAVASWTSSARKCIDITTKTKFVYSDDDADYAIAYALTEDGMHGTGSDWAQSNYLSNNANYASSNPFWYKSPSTVAGVTFNHVGVAAWGIETGIDGSVPSSVVAGEDQEYTYRANISNNKLIQDKANLKVIVMLIDRYTGTIVNAAQTPIEDYNPTGLIGVENTPSRNEGEVYDLSGRRVDSKIGKGLYIVGGKKVLF